MSCSTTRQLAENLLEHHSALVRQKRSESYAKWREKKSALKALSVIARGDTPVDVAGWHYDGHLTLDPNLMLVQLKQAWESEWAVLRASPLEDYQRAYPPRRLDPVELPELTLEMLDAGLRHLGARKKAGCDGWTRQELLHLSQTGRDALLSFYQKVEEHRCWPQCLRLVQVIYLDKGKEPHPLHIRPIALITMLYRLWTAMRLPVMMEVLQRAGPQVVGGRPGKHILREVAGTLIQLEGVSACGDVAFGLHSDLTRAYEKLPLEDLQYIMIDYGIPVILSELIMQIYLTDRYLTLGSASTRSSCHRKNGSTSRMRLRSRASWVW